MKKIELTAFELAQRFVGVSEINGQASNPAVLAMLRLDMKWPETEDVPWCSAFCNYVAWLLRLPRSKSLLARSWLLIGQSIPLELATPGFDVAIFKRGSGPQPGPEEINAPGHVGWFAGLDGARILVLGGNQGNSVSVAGYPAHDLLGIRRLLLD